MLKKQYYQKQFEKYKNDVKNTWGTIKQILNRTRNNQNISDVFLIDNVMTTDPTTIANKFNTFFAGIGIRLSENVNNIQNTHFTDYLLNPSMYNFTFELIAEYTTMEILNTLKPKPSCGYDGISITGAALQLLVSYLSNRKQFVQYGDLLSQKTDILMGVPQGSILGPLLFIIYINDMVHSSELFKFINFADDTTLITNLNNEDMRNESLNYELANFHNYLKANKLSLNVNKTKAMVFHMPQKRIQLPLITIHLCTVCHIW